MFGQHDGGWSGGDWVAMSAVMVSFWALVIGVVVWVVLRRPSGDQLPPAESTNTLSPDGILAERYARGEIDEEEFARRRELLHNTAGSGAKTRSTP